MMEVIVQSTLSTVPGSVTVTTDTDHTVDSLISAFCVEKGIPHRREFVLRTRTDEELNNTKKLEASGVVAGQTLYLGVRVVSPDWPCGCNQWWLLASVALLISLAGIAAITFLKVKPPPTLYDYGVVIDAGSSHSQLYVYRWEADKDNGTAVISEIATCRANGSGISSYTRYPQMAGQSLRPCLSEAQHHVPSDRHSDTRVYLGATAGMRLLSERDKNTSQAIMKSVRDTISQFGFSFDEPPRQVRILTGAEEGAFGWISINYISGAFDQLYSMVSYVWSMEHHLLGALDLGGASTQITFIPSDPSHIEAKNRETLLLYGHKYDVYTHSYNCYGLNEARRRYRAKLVQDAGLALVVSDPCLPAGLNLSLSSDNVFSLPCSENPPQSGVTYTFVGGSNSTACMDTVRTLFNTSSCTSGHCTFDRVHQPPLYGDFLAFSGFYYTMSFFNQTKNNSSLENFKHTLDDFCQLQWPQVVALPGNYSTDQLSSECFNGAFVDQLLEMYTFNDSNWDTITFKNKISGTDLGWAVGFMLNTSNVIPAEFPPPSITTALFAILLVLFIIFFVLSIGFVCHARRVSARHSTSLRYQRMSEYGSL